MVGEPPLHNIKLMYRLVVGSSARKLLIDAAKDELIGRQHGLNLYVNIP